MTRYQATYLFTMVMGVVACQTLPVLDESSPRSRIVPQSRIELRETLTVPAGHARVFLQAGRVVPKGRLNQYQPQCNFEVRQVSDGSEQITADTFVVTALYEDETELVARPQMLWRAGWSTDNNSPFVNRFIRHRLHSPRQPQVMRLTCYGGFGEPWQVHYPSISEIRLSLGSIATVRLAETRGE